MNSPGLLSEIISLGRILFGVFFFAKIFFMYDSRNIVWAMGIPQKEMHNMAIFVLFVSTIFVVLGLFTPIFAALLWFSYVFLNRYAAIYCLEDTVYQSLSFYFIFATSNKFFSLDALFATPFHNFSYFNTAPVAEIALAIAAATIFLSAGLEKAKSSMWQKGLGCYFFFLLPNVRRIDVRFVTKSKAFMLFCNYITLFFEIGFLPIILLNYYPAGAFVWLISLSFVLSLIFVFQVEWIGQGELVSFSIVAGLMFTSTNGNLLNEITHAYSALSSIFETSLFFVMIGTVTASLISILINKNTNDFTYALFSPLAKLSRFTWGIMPITAFNEIHLEGPVVYQVLDGDSDSGELAWPIFNMNCEPGKERLFRPTYFETMAYKITDICLEFDQLNEISEERRKFLIAHASYARKRSEKYLGRIPQKLIYRIVQLNPPKDFIGVVEYMDDWVINAFSVDFSDEKNIKIEKLADKILKYPCGRILKRSNFKFA